MKLNDNADRADRLLSMTSYYVRETEAMTGLIFFFYLKLGFFTTFPVTITKQLCHNFTIFPVSTVPST